MVLHASSCQPLPVMLLVEFNVKNYSRSTERKNAPISTNEIPSKAAPEADLCRPLQTSPDHLPARLPSRCHLDRRDDHEQTVTDGHTGMTPSNVIFQGNEQGYSFDCLSATG